MWDIREDSMDVSTSKVHSLLLNPSPIVRRTSSSRHGSQKANSTSSNLQKSISMLNEKTMPQGLHKSPLLTKTPNLTSFSQSSFLRKTDRSFTDVSMNVSTDYTGIYEKSMDQMSNHRAYAEQTVNASFMDVTVTSAALLAEEDPGIKATSGLFSNFFGALIDFPSDYQIFELIEKYEECCSDQLQLLLNLIRMAPPTEQKFSRTVAMKQVLQEERNTWRLLRALYQDRLHAESCPDSSDIFMNNIEPNASDQTIIQNFYQVDSITRQCQLVIDWLEKNADDQYHINTQMEYFTDNCIPWENTLHFLNKQHNRIHFASKRPIIDQMDPDAPIRQNCPLHDLDQEDDSRMYKLVFSNIRGGALSKAQDLCTKCGQPWLAAALEGWRLAHDPNAQSSVDKVVQDTTGNVFRDTWKAICWRLADDERLSVYERAIYGAFSGNLKLLLNACSSWEDYLWAYLRVMVDWRVEQELRDSSSANLRALPDTYWAKKLTVEQIFEEIEASSKEQVKMESTNLYRIIQKYIILDDIDGLIEQMHDVLGQEGQPMSHILRFMAHLILFLRSIGRSCKEELCIAILKAYVENLIDEKKTELVSFYVSTLPANQQVSWYAKFLEGIQDKDEQKMCLDLARKASLDVEAITKKVVENIRAKNNALENVGKLQSRTTDDDLVKIRAIDWLMFDESQRAEAMKQANALMRVFVVCKKLDAAKEVFTKIPSNSIDIIVRHHTLKTGHSEMPAEDKNATREYLCMQAFLQAHDAFDDWFRHFNHSKPQKPKSPVNGTFAENVAFEHCQKQYENDVDRWKHSLHLQTELVKDRMYNVLLFIDGGWMVDGHTDVMENECRTEQLRMLRKVCIPQLCLLLHSVLHATDQFKEAIQLADIIASNQYELYKVFDKEQLRQFLSKVKDSSLSSLDDNLDSLGYPLD